MQTLRGRYTRTALGLVAGLLLSVWLGTFVTPSLSEVPPSTVPKDVQIPYWIEPALIDVDGASRRGIPLEAFNDIVVHYVGNPGTSARANRNYFNNPISQVSSHFIVGLDGEILQCVPLDEISSASNHRNRDTISIEVCHPDDTGKFNDKTYASLVKLTAWLAEQGNLTTDHIIRHYDVTGKECPRWFVRDPAAWEAFKKDVAGTMKNN